MSSYYEYSYAMEEGMAVITGLLSGIPSTALNIVAYVLTALALYTIAKRRGIHKPWLAWIPVVNCWLVGSISDQYRYVAKGEIKSKRKVLLTLNLINALLIIVCVVLGFMTAFDILSFERYNVSDQAMMAQIMGLVIGLVGVSLAIAGISLAIAVVHFMALYDIYASMDPENKVLFLVLSIIFNVTEPFFLFFNRNKDGGMPPRRDQIPVQERAWQQRSQEPWETENKDYL